MTRFGCALLVIFALLWCLEPVASLVLPIVAQGAGAGLESCLGSLGLFGGGALLLVGAGAAIRLARPAPPRPPRLYGVAPRALPDGETIEGEWIDVD